MYLKYLIEEQLVKVTSWCHHRKTEKHLIVYCLFGHLLKKILPNSLNKQDGIHKHGRYFSRNVYFCPAERPVQLVRNESNVWPAGLLAATRTSAAARHKKRVCWPVSRRTQNVRVSTWSPAQWPTGRYSDLRRSRGADGGDVNAHWSVRTQIHGASTHFFFTWSFNVKSRCQETEGIRAIRCGALVLTR